MADISKITALDGTTYNIKDATARSSIPAAATADPQMDGSVLVGTSTKYAREDHRHPVDTSRIGKSDELLTTNSFAPFSLQGPYISKIDNAFYAANKRWTVTMKDSVSGTSFGAPANLFDGDYESQLPINLGKTGILTIDFSTESNGYFPGYPYGYILVSFYYSNAPVSVSGRVYCNYESQGIGWHDIAFSPINDNTSTQIVYRSVHQSYYNISKLEITIVGSSTNQTKLTQVEMHLDRPNSKRTPFLSKYGAETLYYDLTAPNFNGKINNHTVNSDVPSDAVFTDTKNTTGSTDTSSKIFLVGATSQAANPQTYSHDTAYVGTDGCLYSGGTKVLTAHQDISGKLNTSLKGAANGLAELDANGKVPSAQLPSYVDDVLEYTAKTSFPATGETGKIYVDTTTNLTYRWSGSAYVEISSSLALGETSSTAYRGDHGKIAYDHSQSTHARTDATAVTASSTNGNIKINGTETTVYTHPGSGTNPHGTTKTDIGLDNVGNFKAVSTVASQGLTDTEKSNARENIDAAVTSHTHSYAGSASVGGAATLTEGIPFGVTDSTSTSTIFTATVPGITALTNGTVCYIMNNKVTSAANCTININDLGARPLYLTSASATRVTTQFAIGYTWMLVYNTTRLANGCWDLIYLYNTNTTYSVFTALTQGTGAGYLANSVVYRYQLLFQMDETQVTPLNNNSNSTGTAKTMLTNVEFDPFGEILYYNTTGTINANARVPGGNSLYMANLDLRYSFNCGSTLTAFAPFYLVVDLQSNGKVKLASTTPWSQTLPSTNDGHYYILLGRTYSAYQLSLSKEHPIYYYDGSKICEYIDPKKEPKHRPVQINGTEVLSSDTTPLNLIPGYGTNITSTSSGITFTSSDTYTSGLCGSAADERLKYVNCSGYNFLSNSWLHVIFAFSNTYVGDLLLEVNNQPYLPLYINGSPSSASNYTLPAGPYLVYCDGTAYYLRTDGKLPGNIAGDAATVSGHTVATNVPANAVFTDTTYSPADLTSNGLIGSGTTLAVDLDAVYTNLGLGNVATLEYEEVT